MVTPWLWAPPARRCATDRQFALISFEPGPFRVDLSQTRPASEAWLNSWVRHGEPLFLLQERGARCASAGANLLQDDGAMAGHQMQCHLELSQQCGGPAGATCLMFQRADLRLLALDALAHLDDQAIGLCKFSVSIADPGEATAPPVGNVAAKSINEQLIICL